MYCLKLGSTVTISVEGTDGYTASNVTTINETQQAGTFNLTVPGAETAGIQDVVTLTVLLPDGTKITRTAQLIFH
jgi:hypothetical protein